VKPNMRLDKFLKVSRIVKRRTVANEMAAAGRVEVNGKRAKPGTEVKVGDILDIDPRAYSRDQGIGPQGRS